MGLVLQVLMIVALLVCDSHQLRTRNGVGRVARGNPRPRPWSKTARNSYNTGSGPYDVEVELIQLCDEPGYYGMANLTLAAYNTKTDGVSKIMYRGNFTSPFTEEEIQNLELTVEVYRVKDSKDFKMLDYKENMCKAAGGPAKEVFVDLRRVMGLDGDQCNFPEGSYSFQDWEVNLTLPPPILEYGKYRATVKLFHEGKNFACIKGHGLVKQKM